MNRYERRLGAIRKEMLEHVDVYKGIYAKADEEDRDPTAEEQQDIVAALKAIEVLKEEKTDVEGSLKTLESVNETAKDLGPASPTIDGNGSGPRVTRDRIDGMFDAVDYAFKTAGDQFVESEGFKRLAELRKAAGSLPMNTSSGPVSLEAKGTLLEGAGGGGGALAATVPQVVPGVVEKQFQRLTVADLLLSGQATTNSVRYVIEGTATSGATGVPERGLKPESTLGLTTTDEPVRKIATILPISEEMLEDAPQVRAYINGRLTLFVRIEEEEQLLRGVAASDEVVGIMPSGNPRGINIYSSGTATAGTAKIEVLFKAMNGQRGSALVEPDFYVINNVDWEAIRLAKDTAGQYFGGGPFYGQYGNGGQLAQSTQLGGAEFLWGKPVSVTSALGAGTALVGTSSAGQVWRRGGLSVEASNSHEDFFRRNVVAIRAEERLALAIYRPTAFTETRFLTP